jgi:hypothetical protein
MKSWKFILLIVFLVLFGLLIFFHLKFLSLLSPQGTVKIESLIGRFNPNITKAIFNSKLVASPLVARKEKKASPVLGESSGIKRIEVDLTNQRLYAYEGNQKIYDFVVSTGRWGTTPTGVFRIWIKLNYTLMTGGSNLLGTYYYLPNVPYTMFFYNDQIAKWRGYGIHGTYWHNNFGHPMSHGCINMKTEEAELIYYWVRPDLNGNKNILASNDNLGTEIIIYGTAPNE